MQTAEKHEVIIVTLTDKEGNKKRYEVLFEFSYKENNYAVLTKTDNENEIIILKVNNKKFEPIQEEKEFKEVYQAFYHYLLSSSD